ncbi:MAG: NAD-dependent epimerase/dehydratase family protein [Bacteroidetes bacterium]|nr:NAD-dependent epimerase/dehydratase family protein [Bacteroidota bacterium]MBS1630613.1 NAD-dependent epimerase/dehydratase family protein [Bacteroidota bacterium]
MILVTGASGFVGAHLTKRLSEKGFSVRALYRNSEPDATMRTWPGVEWMRCDLLDVFDVEAALIGIQDVYHCAALVSFNPGRRAEMLHNNFEATANLVNEALNAGIRKLIHISSIAALGRNSRQELINEEAQWEESKLNSAYGQSKYAAEMEVWRGIGEGLEAAMLNPGIIMGEPIVARGWKHGAPALMKIAFKEFPFYTQGTTAFVDVQDVVLAAMSLMASSLTAERFIISENNRSYREIFSLMAESLGKRPPRFSAGPFLSQIVWRFSALKSACTGKSATITRETARNAQTQSFYNPEKWLQAFPEFRYTPMSQTIQRMAAAFKQQLTD